MSKGAAGDPWEPADVPDTTATVLYIGNLDKRVTENMMLDIFRKGLPQVADKVLSAKMVFPTDIQGSSNEAYCFVQFADNGTADLGMTFINGREFFGKKVKVNWAVNSGGGGTPKVIGTSVTIYVGDLDEKIDDNALKKFFQPCGDVLSVKVVREPQSGVSKGFGFVSFSNKMDAQNAIESMNGAQLGTRCIKTNWASRNKAGAQQQNQLNYNEVYQAAGDNNCTVYVGGLPGGIPNDLVRQHFSTYGSIVDTRIFVDKGFAFIKFDSHEAAATAIVKANGSEMHGSYLKCWWGKDGPSSGNIVGGSSMPGGSSQMQNPASQGPGSIGGNIASAQMQQSMNMQGMTPQQQQIMMQYCYQNPYYYSQYMQYWASMQQQMQQQSQQGGQGMNQTGQSQQGYMNPQQYAAMYGYQQTQQQQQSYGGAAAQGNGYEGTQSSYGAY